MNQRMEMWWEGMEKEKETMKDNHQKVVQNISTRHNPPTVKKKKRKIKGREEERRE